MRGRAGKWAVTLADCARAGQLGRFQIYARECVMLCYGPSGKRASLPAQVRLARADLPGGSDAIGQARKRYEAR
jgi:hypothetical protein